MVEAKVLGHLELVVQLLEGFAGRGDEQAESERRTSRHPGTLASGWEAPAGICGQYDAAVDAFQVTLWVAIVVLVGSCVSDAVRQHRGR